MENETEWPTLLEQYEAAASNFEKVSTALRAALARYPLGADFLELIPAEERAREAVVLSRGRLIKFWHDNLDDTMPLRALSPDHLCDCDGPTENLVDESGEVPIAGLYPTCSKCGMLQLPAADVREPVATGLP